MRFKGSVVAFSSFSEFGFASVSTRRCLAFWDLVERLPIVLLRGSFFSELLDFPSIVIVGRESSNVTELSFSIAMVAA